MFFGESFILLMWSLVKCGCVEGSCSVKSSVDIQPSVDGRLRILVLFSFGLFFLDSGHLWACCSLMLSVSVAAAHLDRKYNLHGAALNQWYTYVYIHLSWYFIIIFRVKLYFLHWASVCPTFTLYICSHQHENRFLLLLWGYFLPLL